MKQAVTGPDRSEPVVSVRGLVKRYASREAVAGIDFEVRRGEIFALLVLIVAMGVLILMGERGGERISPFFPFYPAVLLATIYGGARAGVLATLLATGRSWIG